MLSSSFVFHHLGWCSGGAVGVFPQMVCQRASESGAELALAPVVPEEGPRLDGGWLYRPHLPSMHALARQIRLADPACHGLPSTLAR